MTHTTAFVTPVVEHWLEREIAQWVAGKKGTLILRPGKWTTGQHYHTRVITMSPDGDGRKKEGKKEMFYLTMDSTNF